MKYTVQMQFNINSVDCLDVDVEAGSKEEAVDLAIKKYRDGNCDDADFYAADIWDSNIDYDNKDIWNVEKQ